jgi:Tfp pilus assembly protein PilF
MELMNAAPQEQKESVPFVVQRNWVLIALSERTELRQALDRVLARTKTPELLLQDGLLKATEKDYVGARAAFEEVLARNRADLRTLQALARTFVAERRPDAALQRIQQQVSRVPNSADMHQFLGEWLVARNKTQEGRAAFQSAKSIDPGYTRADLSLAGLDLREGKADLARQRLASVVALDGGNIQALTILAIAEEQSGDFPAAIQHYRKVVERDPRNLLALNNLAYLLADRANQPDEALKYAQQVKEIAPDIGAVDDTMGWALYQKQIYVSAVKQLEAAVSREQVFTSEGLARCKYHLAMAYFKAGDRQRGQRSLESALKINPKLPEAKVAQEVRLATK